PIITVYRAVPKGHKIRRAYLCGYDPLTAKSTAEAGLKSSY
ncbi:MAG: hypothetical protein ACJATK_001976, partial [Paracoccaceae bacterium]